MDSCTVVIALLFVTGHSKSAVAAAESAWFYVGEVAAFYPPCIDNNNLSFVCACPQMSIQCREKVKKVS